MKALDSEKNSIAGVIVDINLFQVLVVAQVYHLFLHSPTCTTFPWVTALPCEPDSEAREFQINILGGGCIVSENIYELSVPQHGDERRYSRFTEPRVGAGCGCWLSLLEYAERLR